MNMKLPTIAFLLATTASNAVMADDAPSCTSAMREGDFTASITYNNCIKGKLSKLENTVGHNNRYTLRGGDEIHIYDADDNHKKGRINLTWDTLQVEASENDIPYDNLTDNAQKKFRLATLATCTNIAQNKATITKDIRNDLSSYYIKHNTPNDGNNSHRDIKNRLKNIGQFKEEFCP